MQIKCYKATYSFMFSNRKINNLCTRTFVGGISDQNE